jgi:hypothetical protein
MMDLQYERFELQGIIPVEELIKRGYRKIDGISETDDVYILVCGKEYPIDDYTIRFVYGEDSVTPTHFVITRFDMPKPVAETEE